MLDKRTSALLQSINDFCSSGTYKIFSEEDFLSAFPEKWGVTAEALAQMLNYLSENGYCEQEAEKRSECVLQLKYFISAAFFGSFAGSVLGVLIFAVIYLVMR